MSHNEYIEYKNNLLKLNNERLNELNNKLKELENNIIDSNLLINKNYDLYKENNDEKYVEEAKEVLSYIKNHKKEIEEIKEEKIKLTKEKETITNLNKNDIITKLLKENNLVNIEKELNFYSLTKIDELLYPLCNDLEVLDNIIEEMNKYIKLNNEELSQIFNLSKKLNDYTFDTSYNSSLDWMADLSDCKLYKDELKIFDIDSFDDLENNIEYGINKINKDESELERINSIFDLFPTNIDNYDLCDLKLLILKVLKDDRTNSEIVKNIDTLFKETLTLESEQKSLSKKIIQSKNIVFRISVLEKDIIIM